MRAEKITQRGDAMENSKILQPLRKRSGSAVSAVSEKREMISQQNGATDDSKILELFWKRDESALSAVSKKYGRYCKSVARNIIGNEQAAEEIVNDTLMELWEVIPPNSPKHLGAFVCEVTRNNALDAVREMKAQKRGSGELNMVLDELFDVASDYSVERIAEQHELLELVNKFLGKLPDRKRKVFVLRYWYCYSTSEISQIVGMSEANVYNVLKRVRKSLLEYLEKRSEL